jgi:hypothetical protein
MPFWNNDKTTGDQPADDPRAESSAAVAAHLEERRESLQALTDAAEDLIRQARALVEADANLAHAYGAAFIAGWRRDILAAHSAFKDAVLLHLGDLAGATDLVRRGESALAVRKFGLVLASIRELERTLGDLKRARPDGVPRVSLAQTARLARRPTHMAETLLSIVLEGQAHRAAMGEVGIDDTLSRLVLDIDASGFTLQQGQALHFVWAAPSVLAALAKEPTPATA